MPPSHWNHPHARWSADEVARLRELAPKHTAAQIALALDRSVGAVVRKAHQEGIRLHRTPPPAAGTDVPEDP